MKHYVVNSLMALSFVAASACVAGTPSLPETQNTPTDLSKYMTFVWDQSENIYLDSKTYSISDELKNVLVFSDTVETTAAANARNELLAQDFQDAVDSRLNSGFPIFDGRKHREGGLSLFPTPPSLPSGFKLGVGRAR